MTDLERAALMADLAQIHDKLNRLEYATPRLKDTLRHIEWALDELAKRIWHNQAGAP